MELGSPTKATTQPTPQCGFGWVGASYDAALILSKLRVLEVAPRLRPLLAGFQATTLLLLAALAGSLLLLTGLLVRGSALLLARLLILILLGIIHRVPHWLQSTLFS